MKLKMFCPSDHLDDPTVIVISVSGGIDSSAEQFGHADAGRIGYSSSGTLFAEMNSTQTDTQIGTWL